MRLIDADALKQKFTMVTKQYKPNAIMERAAILLEDVDKAPTIEAEPVRHGKLLRTEAYPHRLYCSECFKTLIPNEEICFEKNEFPKYCMYCGAKMDEE